MLVNQDIEKKDRVIKQSILSTDAMQPEALVPRLGESLIEKGIISADDLVQALEYQKAQGAAGNSILLGEALLHLELVDRTTLDAAITQQIAQLQDALTRSNEMLERRVIERTAELQQALEKLTEMNRVKADFIANMSHELRTPLAHMVGYVDLLSENALGDLNDEQMNAVRVLKKSNVRLGGLIDNLLFLSFDTEEAMPLDLQGASISAVIETIYESARHQAAEANIELAIEVEDALPLAYIDAEKMTWALKQLIDNAIKFNREGGKVLFRAQAKKGKIAVSIMDTGIGIPSDKIDAILEPFVQLDGSSTRKYGGAGLGLSLAKRVIDAHGSPLKIDSKAGHGSRISFYLPLAKGRI